MGLDEPVLLALSGRSRGTRGGRDVGSESTGLIPGDVVAAADDGYADPV